MGTDIHLYVERRVAGRWEYAEELPPRPCAACDATGKVTCFAGQPQEEVRDCYRCDGVGLTLAPYGDRNYDLFSMLADVRNGYGFAGCKTGDGFDPLAEPRGLPRDLSLALRTESFEDGAPWLGDHSFSHATLAELLAYDYDRVTTKSGVVDSATFAEWRERGSVGAPGSWSGGVSGPDVLHVSNGEMDALLESGVAPATGVSRRDPETVRSAPQLTHLTVPLRARVSE